MAHNNATTLPVETAVIWSDGEDAPDAVVEREDLLRIAPQLVLPNRSSFSLDEVLEAVVETVGIDTTPGEDVGTYDSFLRKSVT